MHGKDDDGHSRMFLEHRLCHFGSRKTGHAEVEQQHIDVVLSYRSERFETVSGFRDHFKISFFL
jgi:hypothetical protein